MRPGVVLLAESHVTIHWWPEHDYATVDVFLCDDCAPEDAFLPETVQPQRSNGGDFPPPDE